MQSINLLKWWIHCFAIAEPARFCSAPVPKHKIISYTVASGEKLVLKNCSKTKNTIPKNIFTVGCWILHYLGHFTSLLFLCLLVDF